MAGTFPKKAAAVLREVSHQRAPFHALTLIDSRITGPSPAAC
jgi:hypothetical protein